MLLYGNPRPWATVSVLGALFYNFNHCTHEIVELDLIYNFKHTTHKIVMNSNRWTLVLIRDL